MTQATLRPSFESGSGEISLARIEPFNLRLSREPLRCVTGVTIPVGLVGFCWETPLCLEVLSRQSPDLAWIARTWTESMKPMLETARCGEEHGSVGRR